MLSFLSAWMGLAGLAVAAGVLIGWLGRSPWLAVTYAMAGAGSALAAVSLLLSLRERGDPPGVRGQRVQALIAVGLCALAAGTACFCRLVGAGSGS